MNSKDLAFLSLVLASPLCAADPALLKSEFIYETAPFPSCHASTIVETRDGGLVAAWFGGTREKHPDVGIWVARLEEGRWTAPVEVANGVQYRRADGTVVRHPTWNPVLFQPGNGPLMLFYKAGPSPQTWWGMLTTSTDSGKTWEQPRRLPEGIFGPIKNKPVQLPNGDILCPTSNETDESPSKWAIYFERTRDLGHTWERTELLHDGASLRAIQPSVLFLGGDRLMALGRTREGKIFKISSDDAGSTWGAIALTELPNPNSGTDAVTLRDGRHLLIYNHTGRGRSPLNLAVSTDGETWQGALVLESDPGEYSYPAIIQTSDGLVHATYTWKRQKVRHVVIDPARLNPRPIVKGEWPTSLLNRERMLLVNGQPRFILGLYENPKDDAVLQEAVESGFNLIQCSPDTAALDRVQRLGARAWVNLGGALDLSEDAVNRRQQLTETVRRIKDHPALLVWEGPDEILWNHWWGTMERLRAELQTMRKMADEQPELEVLSRRARDLFERGLYAEFEKVRAELWRRSGQPPPNPDVRIDDAAARVRRSGEGITAGIRAVREMDASHVIWLNHAPRNSLDDLRFYNREADMAGCDIYPAPANLAVGHSDLLDLGLTSVGAYTERMREAAPGRACAMVLQGFGWRDLQEKPNEKEIAVGIGRRPTWGESRFMAYNAIIHGANAILYWGTAYMKPLEDDGSPAKGRPRLWRDLLRVARELRGLEQALVAPPLQPPGVRLAETYGSIDGQGILCTVRRVGSDFVLLVVNETGDGLRFSLEGLPEELERRTLYRLYTPEERQVEGRGMTDGIKPREVHVYATSRRFEDALINAR